MNGGNAARASNRMIIFQDVHDGASIGAEEPNYVLVAKMVYILLIYIYMGIETVGRLNVF